MPSEPTLQITSVHLETIYLFSGIYLFNDYKQFFREMQGRPARNKTTVEIYWRVTMCQTLHMNSPPTPHMPYEVCKLSIISFYREQIEISLIAQ